MTREVAFRAVDFFLALPNPKPSVLWDLTGGEPLLELDLIVDLIKYIKTQTARLNHPWRRSCQFQINTNGVLYGNPKLFRFLWEYRGQCGVAVTLDGTKRKHDMHRVFPGGEGSYDIVSRNFKLFLTHFPRASTKVTFSHGDLPYVRESMLHLWEDIGLKEVAANPVFENVWHEGDAQIYESQLRQLADAIVEKGLWKTRRTNLFVDPRESADDDLNYCGTGKMVAVDSKGVLYPCLRFMNYSLSRYPGRAVGNIYDGFDPDALRPFVCLRKTLQSMPECLNCDMKRGCAWCSGFNLDAADSDTIFQRATFICEMHKARYRASQYLWKQLEERCGVSFAPEMAASQRPPTHVCPI
jgi:uncharacterized protein